MQGFKQVGAVIMLGAVIAACGNKAAATQAPGATQAGGGGTGAGATEAAAATQSSGGGGGGGGTGDTTYGKVTFTVSGPITDSGEFGFVPPASLFGGAAGSSLTFSNGASDTLISIIQGQDGSVVVSYTSTKGQVPAAACTTSDWNMGSNQGSGKFDCKAQFSIVPSGATDAGGEIKGEFSAHS